MTRSEAARAHVTLALWCEQKGLKAEAVAHFTSAVVLDPYHEATWKHLGYARHNGRWMSREQIAADQKEAEAQRKANAHWEPLLKKWRTWLGDKTRRAEAVDDLATVKEPRAVPAIVRVFAEGSEADQTLASQLLGQIDAPRRPRGILGDVGRAQLRRTRVRARRPSSAPPAAGRCGDYAGVLVEQIHTPMKYSVQPVQAGRDRRGRWWSRTPRFKMTRTYDAPPAFKLGSGFRGYAGFDANGLPVVAAGRELDKMAREKPGAQAQHLKDIEAHTAEMLAEANLKAITSQQRLIADVTDIESFNAQVPGSSTPASPRSCARPRTPRRLWKKGTRTAGRRGGTTSSATVTRPRSSNSSW